MTFLIKHHVCTSIVIYMLSNVQRNQTPADVKGSKGLRSTIAICKQTKVCCL